MSDSRPIKPLSMTKSAIRQREQRVRQTPEQTADIKKIMIEYRKSKLARETPEELVARFENCDACKRLWPSDNDCVEVVKSILDPNYVYKPRPQPIIKRTPEERIARKRAYDRAYADRQKKDRLKKHVESSSNSTMTAVGAAVTSEPQAARLPEDKQQQHCMYT